MSTYGYAQGDSRWHLVGETAMLCGKAVEHIPVVQPAVVPAMAAMCAKCWDVQRDGGEPTTIRPRTERLPAHEDTGHCPECWGDVPLKHGRIAAHGAWVMRGGKQVESGEPCPGVGEKPDATQVSA